MKALVIGRGQRVVDTVLAAIWADGFDAVGVTTDADAVAHLRSGSITTLVIGGGVEQDSRESLRQEASANGVTVIESPLGNRDVASYVRQEIRPRLLGRPKPTQADQ